MQICKTRDAKQVTYDDAAVEHSPYFWCQDCFNSMHKDTDGNAQYAEFEAVPYEYEYRDVNRYLSFRLLSIDVNN